MGEISAASNGNVNGGKSGESRRKSCWYEEEIEQNLRWCFALNRYFFLFNQTGKMFQKVESLLLSQLVLYFVLLLCYLLDAYSHYCYLFKECIYVCLFV